jgi:hypothetical protein
MLKVADGRSVQRVVAQPLAWTKWSLWFDDHSRIADTYITRNRRYVMGAVTELLI